MIARLTPPQLYCLSTVICLGLALLPGSGQGQPPAANVIQIDNAMRAQSVATFAQYGARLASETQSQAHALRIEGVSAGGQAQSIGLMPGDFLLQYDGQNVDQPEDLASLVQDRARRTGGVSLRVLTASGQLRSLSVQPGPLGVGIRTARWQPLTKESGAFRIFPQTGHIVWGLSTDRAGKIAVSHNLNGELKVWDIVQQRELISIQTRGNILRAALSPSSEMVLTEHLGILRVWHSHSGTLVWERKTDPGWVATWGNDDEHLWINEGSHLAKWHIRTQLPVGWWPIGDETTKNLANLGNNLVESSPNGANVLVASARFFPGLIDDGFALQPSIFNVASEKWRSLPDANKYRLSAVGWSHDGRHVYVGTEDGRVGIFDVDTMVLRWFATAQSGKIDRLQVSPEGRWLISQAQGNMLLRDASTGNVERVLDAGAERSLADGNTTRIRNSRSAGFLSKDSGVLMSGNAFDVPKDGENVRFRRATFNIVPLGENPPPSDRFPGVWEGYASTVSSDGKLVARITGSQLQLWDIETGRLNGTVRTPSGIAAYGMAFAPSGRSVWILGSQWTQKTSQNDEYHLWHIDIATGRQILKAPVGTGVVRGLAVSPDGERVAIASNNGELFLYAASSGRQISRLKAKQGTGEVLAGALGASGRDKFFHQLRFSRDSRQLIALGIGLTASEVWDIATGTQLRELPPLAADFLLDGRLLVGRASNISESLSILAATASETDTILQQRAVNLFTSATEDIRVSPAGDVAAVARGQSIELWSLNTKTLLKSLPIAGGFFNGASMAFSSDGSRLIVSNTTDLRIWSVEKGKELVRLLEVGDGEWVAMTPQGYFNASSSKAADFITIFHNGQLLELGQFYEFFYRPDLVLAALSGQELPIQPSGSLANTLQQLPPRIEHLATEGAISGEKVKVRYTVSAQAGGVGDVRVYQNGKLVRWERVQSSTQRAPITTLAADTSNGMGRALAAYGEADWKQQAHRGMGTPARTPSANNKARRDYVIEVEAIPGRNEISVLAFNANNTVASRPAQVAFDSNRSAVPPALHILAIGINEYDDKRAQLLFAAKDAKDVAAKFSQQGANIYGIEHIHVTRLLDREASREKIIANLEALAQRTKPSDHVLLFVAGHGVIANGNYHMVASNYDGKLSPGNSVSAEEIVDRSRRIPALSQWLIFDTCHAGGLGDLLRGLYDARVQVLARQSGMHVFAAASTTQEAIDGYEGSGLFTHSLLHGIGNTLSADTNGDKQVSITELGAFAKRRTQDLARQLQHRQEPLILHHGSDRPVAKR